MTTEQITTIIVAILGSGALSALVSNLFSLFKEKKGLNKLVMMLTADKLYDNFEKMCEDGYAEEEKFKLSIDMYTIYKEQKGNGYADALKNKAEKLPIKK